MAQYKVPQDVEADDKLLGPFSFRQFVYLLITGGLIALGVGLFQIFPLLAIIPVPFVLLFGALALPLRKDQPMETYLAAIVSYYLKPHKRLWVSGQRESTVQITAPKVVEESRVRSITGEEATHRLSFLADIVDTEGYAIKGASSNPMREDLVAEANATSDMFENNRFDSLGSTIVREENKRHNEVIEGMRAAIERNENLVSNTEVNPIQKRFEETKMVKPNNVVAQPVTEQKVIDEKVEFSSPVVVMPEKPAEDKLESKPEEKSKKVATAEQNHSIIDLANNSDYTVATIAKEAKRIKERDEGEVFISLH